MPLQVSRLRRWFAVGAAAAVLVVAGGYFYARHRLQNALKEIPGKMGIEIEQSAQGFTVSKSEAGRTLFKIQASKAVRYKQGGLAELHDVQITVYGRESDRFDQIYGSEFEYDQASGTARARGEVQIDLEANPAGLNSPDQSTPRELKNPIHLVTSNLVFNKNGDAYTRERVTFSIPQASGAAVGVSYVAKNSTLTMQSQVHVDVKGPTTAALDASRAVIAKAPRTITLGQPHLKTGKEYAEAGQGVLFLRPDNTIARIEATAGVLVKTLGKQPAEVRAEKLELVMAPKEEAVRIATFSGDVRAKGGGLQAMEGQAGRAVLSFTGMNLLNSVHAEQNVRLAEQPKPSPGQAPQNLELQAAAVDFRIAAGRRLDSVQTAGVAQVVIRPQDKAAAGRETVVTAGKFQARFNSQGQMVSVQGSPNARIVNRDPGQPDGISTSDVVDAGFGSHGGIESIVQRGNVAYSDGQRRAWGQHARYTPADHILTLTGNPRVVDGGMTTTARTMRMDRAQGDALAEGDVKTTYSDLKPEPNGALLASGSPIHVTARAMTAHRTPAVALYTGGVRLWQDANVVQAPSIEFDRDHRSVLAQSDATQAVSTVLVQTDKQGRVTPVSVTSARLTYTDNERQAHFEGNVVAKGVGYTVATRQMDVYLQARGVSAADPAVPSAGKIDRIVAQGQVRVTQPNRRATGERLVYTAKDEKFVMTGGSPSIFDAERGKITGVSLTFYEHDDRVLVEGSATSPSVTETRVAR
jgi:lipopolysaccharide export system protein LptA